MPGQPDVALAIETINREMWIMNEFIGVTFNSLPNPSWTAVREVKLVLRIVLTNLLKDFYLKTL